MVDLMIDILRSLEIGLGTVELAGELIAEDARYNAWVYGRKPRSTEAELWNIVVWAHRLQKTCEDAWKRFASASDAPRVREDLQSTLRSVTERLRAARISDAVEFDDPDMPDDIRNM
jgi:hypothetical protein